MSDQEQDPSAQDVNDEKDEVQEESEALLEVAAEDDPDVETIEEEVVEEETEETKDDDAPESRENERIRDLVETVNRQQKLLEAMVLKQHGPKDEADPEIDDPEVAKIVQQKLTRAQQAFQQQLGQVAEENDAIRFDRVLEKEGVEEGTPEHARITTKLQQYREDQAQQGHYFKRADAYAMLKAQGKLAVAKPKKPVKKVTVVKNKPNVVINRNTNKSNKPDTNKKNFKQLPLSEKEKALENIKF